MAPSILRRFGFLLLTMALVSAAVFFISEIVPLDVARNILGQFATDEQVAALRERMGLDRPAHVRYAEWLARLVQGDLGVSTLSGTPVVPLILRRVGNSAILAAVAFLAIMPLGLLLGTLAGLWEGRFLDRVISVGGLVSTSTPPFASGVVLILLFALWLQWLPGTSALDTETWAWEVPSKLALPVLALILADVGYVARMTRASVAEVMRTAYVRTAILKGLPFHRVVVHHVLRNALLAPITVVALHLNWLMGGLVVVESLFGFPGLGRLMLEAALNKDVPVIEAGALIATFIAVASQCAADITYTALNPRIRYR